jgi:hypothetical protein
MRPSFFHWFIHGVSMSLAIMPAQRIVPTEPMKQVSRDFYAIGFDIQRAVEREVPQEIADASVPALQAPQQLELLNLE